MNRPEVELLLACVRSESDGCDRNIELLLGKDLDWTFLVQTALANGVSPLVADRLVRAPAESIPETLRVALSEHLDDNRERNVALARALLELLDALRARGVDALPFKGQTLAVLATGAYTMRRAGDLDVFVRRKDLAETWVTLEALGYRESTEFELGRPMTAVEHHGYLRYQCEYAFLRKRDRVFVEPHWAIAPTMMAIDLDYERMWNRASSVDVAGTRVPTLGLADLLPVLCIHGSKHEWTRLQWIADIAALIERFPQLDLGEILDDARSRGLARMTLLGLGLAERVLGTRMPAAVSDALEADSNVGRLIKVCAGRLFVGGTETTSPSHLSRLRLEMRERRLDRARCVLRTALTPTEKHYRMCALPAALSWLYVPLKIAHDYIAAPLWRVWQRLGTGSTRGRSPDAAA